MQKRSIAEAEKIYEQVAAGKTNEVPGLLEQWLREGKMSEKDAIYEAAGLFSTAIDSVSFEPFCIITKIVYIVAQGIKFLTTKFNHNKIN